MGVSHIAAKELEPGPSEPYDRGIRIVCQAPCHAFEETH
jgi:hypothetical protein